MTTGDGFESINESTTTVDGPATFNGQSTIRLFGNSTSPEGATNFESFVGAEAQRSLVFGNVSEPTAPPEAAGTIVTTLNDPAFLRRFDLVAGQSYSQTYRQTVTVTSPLTGTLETGQTVESEITFVGLETVAVPAGTFTACRFDEMETITTDEGSIEIGGVQIPIPATVSDSESSTWIAVGNGLPVKSTEEDSTTAMTAAQINGVPVSAP